MSQIIAILETMWDWRSMTSGAGYTQEAPRYFRINPQNHSGRRLYKLIGEDHKLLVTNACRELVQSARHHGRPDPVWLRDNLQLLAEKHPFKLVLVCGAVAKRTFEAAGVNVEHLIMPHPAARIWTADMIDDIAAQIAGRLA